MGASLGLAGLATTGCIRLPEEKLAPYAHRPENRTPGTPVSYATAMEIGGVAQGLLVTSFDGRPIKIEGNPSHPLNRGAADMLAQASVLELYDPDRSRGVMRTRQRREAERKRPGTSSPSGPRSISRATAASFASSARRAIRPAWLRCGPSSKRNSPRPSGTNTKPVSDDNVREGTLAAFGQHVLPVLELADAKVIVSLDADLFGGGSPLAIKYARDFAAGRRLHDEKTQTEMNRLYVIESLHTITGASADHRLACAGQ